MLIYWAMLLATVPIAFSGASTATAPNTRHLGAWIGTWIALTILIGFRFRVGGDWHNYYESYLDVVYLSLLELFGEKGDPAYWFINWVSVYFDWDIYGVNIICGGVFTAGLVAFCRAQPRPWLALTVSIPYLVIVVAMGYTRQSAAIGLVMLALTYLGRKDTVRFVFWVALGALFHKSAVIVVPIAILARIRNPWWTLFWVGATSVVLYVLLVLDFTDQLIQGYIDAQYESEGAVIRVFMNVVPAVAFLAFRRRMTSDVHERAVWTWLSLLAIGFVPLLEIVPSSTALDRVALYMIPLQLYVLSRVPDAVTRNFPLVGVGLVVGYSALVQFVWLNYAAHAEAWIPYRFYPFETWL